MSTPIPIAAGIATLLIDFMRQFMNKENRVEIYTNMRKLFLAMSETMKEKDYQYLALSYLFESRKDAREFIKEVISHPAGMGNLSSVLSATLGRNLP